MTPKLGCGGGRVAREKLKDHRHRNGPERRQDTCVTLPKRLLLHILCFPGKRTLGSSLFLCFCLSSLLDRSAFRRLWPVLKVAAASVLLLRPRANPGLERWGEKAETGVDSSRALTQCWHSLSNHNSLCVVR